MTLRFIPFALFLLTAFYGTAQTPGNIILKQSNNSGAESTMACADQFAGTVSFANFVGQSNDIDLDTIYFCFGDAIDIFHNGDQDLTGDPDPTSQPGVSYAFYTCEPTITGPNLTSVLTDPCILDTPPPAGGIWINVGGSANGDATFANDGTIQQFFNPDINNVGQPILIWFAPITVDDFPNIFEADPNTMEEGPCVNVNTDQAFAVVYLNELTITNENNNAGASGCQGTFDVAGGLPGFEGGNYDIDISLTTDPTVKGTIQNMGGITDGETVTFNVPVPGVYSITVSDGKSCEATALMDMNACVTLTLEIGSATASMGQNFCIPITTTDDFIDIAVMQFSMNWDGTVLMYTGVQNLNPNLGSFGPFNFNPIGGDALVVSWDDLGQPNSLPAGVVLFEICFDAIGDPGTSSPVIFSGNPSPIEIGIDNNGMLETIGFNGVNGQADISSVTVDLAFTQDSVSCFGFSDGAFTVDVTGGQDPYQIQWQAVNGGPLQGPIDFNGQTYTSPNNLAAGQYSVTVTDMTMPNPVSTVDTVEILQNPTLEIIFLENEPQCNGDSGTIEVVLGINNNPIFDVTGYSFEWSTGDMTQETSLIDAGLYSITVTDPNGCVFSDQTFLFDPEPITLDINITNATCPGIDDGAISIMINGGTPDNNGDYTIVWKNIGGGLTFMNDVSNVSGLATGFYVLCITDNNDCVFTTEIEVPADKEIGVNAVVDSVNCNGENSGSIIATGFTNGAAPDLPYNFAWQGVPPPPPPINTPTTTQLSGLAAGTYILTMQDQAGCEIQDTSIVFEPAILEASILDTIPESCAPGSDGGFVASAMGGTAPYVYNWGDGPMTDSMAMTLVAGNYNLTVADANNCFVVLPFTISQPAPPEILAFENDTLNCGGDMDGTLSVVAVGDIASYDWNTMDVGPTLNNLSAGEYIVTVTANNGCEAIDTAYVVEPIPLTLDSVVTIEPICPNQGGGQISLFVSGGMSPYFYDWNPIDDFDGVNNSTAGGIIVTAGDYQIEVIDANLCPSLVVDVTLDDPPSPVIQVSNIQPVSCPSGICDGDATAEVSLPGSPNELFTVIWASNEQDNDVTTSTASQLCQGDQIVVVSYGQCSDSIALNVPAPTPFVVNFDIDNVTCTGAADGSIEANVSGATGPYTYMWSNNMTTNPVTNLPAGNYSVVIQDANNCTTSADTELVDPEPFFIFENTVESMDVSCNGFSDGVYAVVPQGGTGNVTYTWQNGIANPNSAIANGLPAGNYSVTATDAQGCQDILAFVISEPSPFDFELAPISPVLCNGDLTSVTVLSVNGGSPGPYNFTVGNLPPLELGLPQQIFAGEYVVSVFDVSNSNCTSEQTIIINEPSPINVELPSFVEIELGDTMYQMNPIIQSSLPIDSFLWTPNDGLLCSGLTNTNCPNPFVNIIDPAIYQLTIIDANGCTASAEIEIDVDANRNVFIPNIFSPNDDGRNDVFRIYTGLGVKSINFMRIYDRWGDFIFEAKELMPTPNGTIGWDGRFNGQRMNAGVFLYMIEVEFLDGQVLLYRGDVTLLR